MDSGIVERVCELRYMIVVDGWMDGWMDGWVRM